MSAEHRARFTPPVVVGVSIMLLGLVLMLDRLGVADARTLLQMWPVLLIVFGASVVVQALRGGSTPPDGSDRTSDTVGLVALLVAAFLLVSLVTARRDVKAAPAGMHAASVFALAGRDEQTAPAQPFHGGEITTIMGRTRLDLRQAILEPGTEAVLEILGMVGRVVVIVPSGWNVDVQTTSLMGAVRTRRAPAELSDRSVALSLPPEVLERPDPPAGAQPPPRLVLRGVVMIGVLIVE